MVSTSWVGGHYGACTCQMAERATGSAGAMLTMGASEFGALVCVAMGRNANAPPGRPGGALCTEGEPCGDLLSHGLPHYHRRSLVSRSCSGWEGVGPRRYGRKAKLLGGSPAGELPLVRKKLGLSIVITGRLCDRAALSFKAIGSSLTGN